MTSKTSWIPSRFPDPVGSVLRCTHPNFAHTRKPNLSLLYICDLHSQPNRIRRGNLDDFKNFLNPVAVPRSGRFGFLTEPDTTRKPWWLQKPLQSRRCFCLGVSVRLNSVEKSDVDVPNTPESQWFPTLSIQERSETQLYAVSPLETSKPKRWVSLGFWWMWRIWRQLRFSMIFRVLVASVQPNLRD